MLTLLLFVDCSDRGPLPTLSLAGRLYPIPDVFADPFVAFRNSDRESGQLLMLQST